MVDMKAIDGGIGDRGAFFKEYSTKWHVRVFSGPSSPSIWMLFIVGYFPAIIFTALAVISRAPIVRPDKNSILLNHTNLVDIAYWSQVSGLDVYCAPGSEIR